MSLNPVDTSRHIFERYCSYISTTFRLNRPELNDQVQAEFRSGKFAKGPFLEVTLPFKEGLTIDELIEEDILSPHFRNINKEALPTDRPLYIHQEDAIRKIVCAGRNIVVATGTGSGKTESFMIPILNHLFRQVERGVLEPGVRALLLYPMNALANDQMKRLRKLLANNPEITFGIYTGETEDEDRAAREKYLRMYEREPLPNELISRSQMKKTPPHILITNYAMLEYLMLRPDDHVFFQGRYADEWKFVVLDEAHTYTGAKAIEMSMLLARLKTTIGLRQGDLTCIMTSATLGRGVEDAAAVAKFAGELFREEFSSSDIINAQRLEPAAITVNAWGKPDPRFYHNLNEWISLKDGDPAKLQEILLRSGIPQCEYQQFVNTISAAGQFQKALYQLLQGDERIVEVISLLQEGPMELEELTDRLFGAHDSAKDYTISLIELCNLARLRSDDRPLLPARYHFFIRALEGAFIVLSDRPKIYLERLNFTSVDDKEYRAFELGACTRCHGLYLVGSVSPRDDGLEYLAPVKDQHFGSSDQELEFFALIDEDPSSSGNGAVAEEDELLETLGMKVSPFKVYRLCVHCGAISYDNGDAVCGCSGGTVRVRKVDQKDGRVYKCGICGAVNPRGNIIRRFYLSEDAIASVLTTALYEKIPERLIEAFPGEVTDDPLARYFGHAASALEREETKQLLVFSDSRQNAAYFAAYLDATYKELLAKHSLVATIESHREACLANRWTLADFHRRIMDYIQAKELLQESTEATMKKVWQWIMSEFAMDMGMTSLERMGLIAFVPNFAILKNAQVLWELPMLRNVGFTPEEVRVLYEFYLDQFRIARAVEFPEAVKPTDEYFTPINQQGGFCIAKPQNLARQPKGYAISNWIPSEGHSNTRLDYLEKLLAAGNISCSRKEAVELLEKIWESILHNQSPLYMFVKDERLVNTGRIYKLDLALFKVVPGRNNPEVKYYRCKKCHRLTRFNIRDVCPSFRCEGKLVEVDLDQEFADHHYRNIYLNMSPEHLVAHEHTAQLATEYAAEVQTRFIHGRINILSCSTTFELGVDVGELETVFMKNMPPTPANYVQRAGRAGRRTSSTAYALTYARLASHDFSNFQEPEKMIRGVVRPPYFNAANAKIARRHVYACAFAMFWRRNQDYFGKVENFFCSDGPARLREFLRAKPEELKNMLLTVVPEALHDEMGIGDWSWVDELYAQDGVMAKVIAELEHDLEGLEQAKQQAADDEEYSRAAELKRVIHTVKSRPLINYLAQRNLLPKYGFPVDVVNLHILLHTEEAQNIELSRDMQIAISEYAPESEVVANGKLWTSRHVKRLPKKELLTYWFIQCSCGYFEKHLTATSDEFPQKFCPACGTRLLRIGRFVKPEFGFIAEPLSQTPRMERPRRTYSGRKFFSQSGSGGESKEFSFNGPVRLYSHAHGSLTVVNMGEGEGFYICRVCGFGTLDRRMCTGHKNAHGFPCDGIFDKVSLGYDFETDIVQIDCNDALRLPATVKEGYWESLLYSILEGMSYSLDIDRNDIDGTIHVTPYGKRTLILFDTVPGGAGHVKRIMEEENFRMTLEFAREILERCSCGGSSQDTSCYGCLRNYYNQFLHDRLKREHALDALGRLLG